MLTWLKSLFAPALATPPSSGARSESVVPDATASTPQFSGVSSVPAHEFASRTARAPAAALVDIAHLVDTIFAFDASLVASGIDRDAAADLRAQHLIGICPQCDSAYSHRTFTAVAVGKMMPGMPASGAPGVDRLLSGRCSRANCGSTTVLLFWCADLDSDAVRYLAARGVDAGSTSVLRDARWPAA